MARKMTAEAIKVKSRNDRNIKEVRIPERKKERPVPRKMNNLYEHLHIRTIVQYLDVQIQGRQKATMVSVCVKGEKARAEETMCINNNKNNCKYKILNNKMNN